jgi:hypothetical protein
MRNLSHRFAAITALIAFHVGAASAEVLSLTPLRDTTIFADSNDTASSAGVYAFVGNTASGQPRRALFVFDFADVPAGSQVVSASFSISVDRAAGGEQAMTLHRLLADWGTGGSDASTNGGGTLALPGDATWSHRFFGDATRQWRNGDGEPAPGGWFVATPSATTVVGGPDRYTWSSVAGSTGPSLVTDVQAWLDAPATNFGWILVGDETVSRTAKRFGASEISVESLRPTLTLEIVPIPEPTTYAMMFAGLALLSIARQRSRRG